MEGLVVLEQL